MIMEAQTFWNEIGSKKNFEDPLSIDKFSAYINSDSKIVEYGCGYGRLMNLLKSKGYQNIIGFDYAPNMIERGNQTNPDLDLRLIEKSAEVPLEDGYADLVIMSTILCCVIEKKEQEKIIQEMKRILKPNGLLYVSDFIVSSHPRYVSKYQKGFEDFGIHGVYTTDEGIAVKHYTTKEVTKIFEDFDILWFEQFDFKTMNQNVAKTFHLVGKLLPQMPK